MAEVTFKYDGDEYAFNVSKFSVLEGIELKKLTGMTFVEWAGSLESFEAESVRFLVWLVLGRAGKRPDVKYREFDFDMIGLLDTISRVDDEAEDEPVDPTPVRPRRTSKPRSKPTAP